MKKILVLVSVVMMASMLFTACANKSIELTNMNGETVEIDVSDFTEEQINALEEIADGDNNMMYLIQSGLFTMEQLQELTLMDGNMMANRNMGPGGNGENMPQMTDFSDIDIDDLHIEGLTEEQINKVKELLAGSVTLQSILEQNILSQEELMTIGLMNANSAPTMERDNLPSNRGQKQ